MSERDLEEKIVQHCAETLQGIKAASLFVLPLEGSPLQIGRQTGQQTRQQANQQTIQNAGQQVSPQTGQQTHLAQAFASCRKRLATRGVHMIPLTRLKTGIVLYVYRPRMLAVILKQPGVNAFLAQAGYTSSDPAACVAQLRQRVRAAAHKRTCPMKCAYPHEIGVFLGYPLADVVGFIENEGKNYLLCGCWKVYANVEEAHKTFHALKKCRACLHERFCAGASMEELIA